MCRELESTTKHIAYVEDVVPIAVSVDVGGFSTVGKVLAWIVLNA